MPKASLLALLLLSLTTASTISLPKDNHKIGSFLQLSSDEASNKCQQDSSRGYINLPDDEGGHENLTEWWYWVSQVFLEDGTHFLGQWVFVKKPLPNTHSFDVDFILYGPDRNKYLTWVKNHEFSEEKGKIALDFGDVQAYNEDRLYQLYGKVDEYSLNITFTPTKAPVVFYEDGRVEFTFGGYLDYYAFPRHDIQGTLKIGDEIHQVTGFGYYEHAFGRIEKLLKNGWDWFEMNLDDGTDIMIAIIRMNYYVWVYDKDCNFTTYTRNQFKLEVMNTWQSPKTKCQFATAWKLSFDDKEYIIETIRDDMEFLEAPFTKFAAALKVSGSGTGRGMMEDIGIC